MFAEKGHSPTTAVSDDVEGRCGPLYIDGFDIESVTVPYLRPFGISSGSSEAIESLLLHLHASGYSGTGETVAMTAYTGFTAAGIKDVLAGVLAPAVRGADARDIVMLHQRMDSAIRGQSVAKSAIDIAAHDLVGKVSALPVAALLGGSPRAVESAWVCGLGGDDHIVADAVSAESRGYRHIKVKGGVNWRRDVNLVLALRSALSAETELAMDLNEGYSRQDARAAVPRLCRAGLDLVEQPLAGWDLRGLRELRALCDVPIMVDESVQSVAQAAAVIAAEAADVVNIKVIKLGGLMPARRVADLALAAGLPVKLGTMPELGVATRAAAHLSAACINATVPGDLVGPVMTVGDPFRGRDFGDDGSVRLADIPGLGTW